MLPSLLTVLLFNLFLLTENFVLTLASHDRDVMSESSNWQQHLIKVSALTRPQYRYFTTSTFTKDLKWNVIWNNDQAALGLAVVIVAAYATFPSAREWIITSAPFLFFLLCPLMMFFMMTSMQSCHKQQKTEEDQSNKAPDKPLTERTVNARRSSFKP